MSGRYAFSLPEPRQRDGWFKVGPVDVTTTALIVGIGVASMVLYAISPAALFQGAFWTDLVRQGEVWRVVTWPLVNPPLSVWDLVGLLIFWFLGHMVEDVIGRKPYTWLVLAMTVVPTLVVSVLDINNRYGVVEFGQYAFSVSLLSIGMITIFGLDNPNARFFFGIPAWVIAAAFVFIEVVQNVGNRAWANLTIALLVVVVGCFGAAQRGMLAEFEWIPRIKALGGGPVSPYGIPGSARPKAGKRFGKGRSRGKAKGKAPSSGSVVSGPWGGPPSGGPTPLEQAELDVLLDRISAGGIDSLTPHEKERLNALSKRMRES